MRKEIRNKLINKQVRKLTGNWYLKKKWFGYIIMVEIQTRVENFFPDRSEGPEYTQWVKAKDKDLFELKINVL